MERIGQPRNERSRRTRIAILDAVWKLLEEEGGSAVTMGQVATRAGVSRRTLYLHFHSRTDLIMELHSHVDEALGLEESLRPVFDAPDGVTALDALAAHLVRYHRRILAIDRAVEFGRRAGDPDLAALWGVGAAAWLEGCLALVQRLEDAGRLARPWTVVTAADMLFALMRHDVLETLAVDRGWPEDQHRELLATVFRRTFVN